jgi:hypothetical protein
VYLYQGGKAVDSVVGFNKVKIDALVAKANA